MIRKVSGYVPGLLGRITELHGMYYYQHWEFDLFFESKVAIELADFLNHFNSSRDGLWVAYSGEQIVGSIAISGRDADTVGARLRWLIVASEQQNKGIGKRLMREAIGFCKEAGFKRVYLTTFGGLDAARNLYEREGFHLTIEEKDSHWGKTVLEQTFELLL
ncbi:MAG TPA: GNAT family N-acetyltransferase [Smithellaceae bacterium]|nr:GNAT family N-acetyltransferase [Smithellaceae bacterium]